jgi:hypothetical protein
LKVAYLTNHFQHVDTMQLFRRHRRGVDIASFAIHQQI